MNDNKSPRMAKLKQQQQKIRKQITLEKKRLSSKSRKDDTRRKILIGSVLQKAAKEDTALEGTINTLLRSELTRNDDRALFGLSPLPENKNETKTGSKK